MNLEYPPTHHIPRMFRKANDLFRSSLASRISVGSLSSPLFLPPSLPSLSCARRKGQARNGSGLSFALHRLHCSPCLVYPSFSFFFVYPTRAYRQHHGAYRGSLFLRSTGCCCASRFPHPLSRDRPSHLLSLGNCYHRRTTTPRTSSSSTGAPACPRTTPRRWPSSPT